MSNEEKLIVSFDDFVDSLELEPKIDFETYSEQLGVLYTNYARMDMDSITKPASRYNVKNFILKCINKGKMYSLLLRLCFSFADNPQI